MDHVVQFYKQLFGDHGTRNVMLAPTFLEEGRRVSQEDIIELIKPFSKEEIKKAISEMRKDAAQDPNGYGAFFFQYFWDRIKDNYYKMFLDFYKGNLDIRRLNYGVRSIYSSNMDQRIVHSESDRLHTRHRVYTSLGTWYPTSSLV
jgi:hypothetical protein